MRYVGLEQVESQTGRIGAVSDTEADTEVASSTFAFDSRHVLYGKLRPYLNKVALPDFAGRCTTEIIPLLPTDAVTRDYLWLLLRSPRVVSAAVRSSVGSRMPRADMDQVLGLEVSIHERAMQLAVVASIRAQEKTVQQAAAAVSLQVDAAAKLLASLLRTEFSDQPPIRPGSVRSTDPSWGCFELRSLARLESGHTPSRRHPEWWGGDVPWLALPDIRKLHGKVAHATTETINDAGLANSSARLLPAGTVCLCRDASIGFVTMLGRPMATSQHFCNWICDPERLDPEFLMYAFMASFDSLRELGSGSVLKTIYMPTIESFHLHAPPLAEQRRIARRLREQLAAAEALQTRLAERQAEIERLPQRILAAAFGDA